MKIDGKSVRVWFNKNYADCYTIVIGDMVYGMSKDPFAPTGFSQFVGDYTERLHYTKHWGKKIEKEEDLPKDVVQAIRQRFE